MHIDLGCLTNYKTWKDGVELSTTSEKCIFWPSMSYALGPFISPLLLLVCWCSWCIFVTECRICTDSGLPLLDDLITFYH